MDSPSYYQRKLKEFYMHLSMVMILMLVEICCSPAMSQSIEGTEKNSATAQSVSSDVNPIALEKYLKQMHQPITEYLRVMIDLVPLDQSSDSDVTKHANNDVFKKQQTLLIIDSFNKISPPSSMADLQVQLRQSLFTVVSFINAGGLSKLGFSKALQIAQQMQSVSDQYHAVVLKEIAANKLPQSIDPFLVPQVKTVLPPAFGAKVGAGGKGAHIRVSDVVISKETEAQANSDVARSSFSGIYSQAQPVHDPSSIINGVGGSMGMSGLFNGLGGTGTNGLVDGLGFSSGLNGYVNGASVSSGTSGFFNDMNVMTAP